MLERHHVAPREHTKVLLPMVSELLAESGLSLSELDALVLGRGPGSFTGLRIAAGVVQGLAFSADRPVVLVSTLAMLAQPWIDRGHHAVIAAMDARMGEVYWGAYRSDDQGLARQVTEEAVLPPLQACPPEADKWVGVGPGFAAYEQALSRLSDIQVLDCSELPRARCALPIAANDFLNGLYFPPEAAQPVYLRNRVAQTLEERR